MIMNEKIFLLKKDRGKDPEAAFLEQDEHHELLKTIESLTVKYREVFCSIIIRILVLLK